MEATMSLSAFESSVDRDEGNQLRRSMSRHTYAQDLFDWSMHIQDNRYDASYNFIQYSDKGPWSTRFTAWYVAGLLHRNQGDDLKHAEASIRNILACQMTEDFDAPWYGTYKLSPDEPDPTLDSGLYVPKIYTTYDPNWRDFIGTQLIQILSEFSPLLAPSLITSIEDSLEIAAVGSMRRNGTYPTIDDNLTIGYTNPAMMRALLCEYIGTRRSNSTFLSFAEDQGKKILQLFQREGAETLSEYNAPTYYGIDVWAMGAQIKYGVSDSSMTKAAKYILPKMMGDLAEHYNGYLGNVVGPYDRAYTRDITQHSSVLSLVLWGLWGRERTSQPKKMEGDLLFDVAQGAAMALVLGGVEKLLPAHVEEVFTTRDFVGEPRWLNRTVWDELEGGEPRIASSWVSKELMIGGQQVDEDVNRGDQFVPAIVHWAGDKEHKPYPLNTFFALYPSASSIHAVASPNHLSVSYPNRTQEGSDIFTFALSNVPPSWTLGTGRRITGFEDLPCVEIEVEAAGLVKQNVTYGTALRNHLFYNISYVVPEDFEGVPRVELEIRYTC
ncbi:hypothetical protein BKA58DRAFT_180334 [Alternaria rosae]|uniref:uncharacterized protein n=1 Tax=Alternaria rosae TaxID=1187941 RepID=UPI001E8E658E|nr:uncharacterized protein BKA58DRAFT_180334 [Alternaria rosae]KAH6870641.1 hypothetical protein BKA58DRAFT_180334 [Alternaria rosae]